MKTKDIIKAAGCRHWNDYTYLAFGNELPNGYRFNHLCRAIGFNKPHPWFIGVTFNYVCNGSLRSRLINPLKRKYFKTAEMAISRAIDEAYNHATGRAY